MLGAEWWSDRDSGGLRVCVGMSVTKKYSQQVKEKRFGPKSNRRNENKKLCCLRKRDHAGKQV